MAKQSSDPGSGVAVDDPELLAAIRQGDEQAFETLLNRYHASLIRVAMMYVRDRRIAEEVAQDTWVGVLKGLSKFEGRSAFKTWIFSILLNKARTTARRESRHDHFGSLEEQLDRTTTTPAVPPSRFNPANGPGDPGHWALPPQSWDGIPEERLLSQETQQLIRQAIENLPPNQREVIILRDIEQWTSEEVCNVLAITDTNQRVLLHRARSRVREALEQYLKQ